jgi:hypothetical protein
MAQAQPAPRLVPLVAAFDEITLVEIGARFKNDLPGTIQWLRDHGLLANRMDCPLCGYYCNEHNAGRKLDGKIWSCRNKDCEHKTNIRYGSFFEGSKIHLWQILVLTYLWATSAGRSRGMSQDIIRREAKIGGEHTVVDWFQFCRDVPVEYFLNNPSPIGGINHVVEIDESLFARRKYNRGRIVPEQWILGGYDQQTKHGFLVPVPRRDAATLLPIIQQWVLPNTEIWTDMWAAYNNIAQLGYQHGTVNHTHNFVDPVTGVCTNRVEAMWQRSKAKFKAQMGPSNRGMIPDYLSEFMWAQRFGGRHAFFNFWTQVSQMYPVLQ